jgi:hypothetical protein
MIGSPDDVLARMQEAGRLDLGDYLLFEVAADPRHPEIDAEGMAYQGLRYRVEAQLADIALLATARDIDGAMLRAAIDRTFEHRASICVGNRR